MPMAVATVLDQEDIPRAIAGVQAAYLAAPAVQHNINRGDFEKILAVVQDDEGTVDVNRYIDDGDVVSKIKELQAAVP